MLELIEVTDKKTAKIWLEFGSEIYKDMPSFVPYVKQDIAKVFNPTKNKAFEAGKAIRWIIRKDNIISGRIACFIEKKYFKYYLNIEIIICQMT